MLEGEADEKLIEAEMLYQFKEKIKWNIKRISEKEFVIVFPSDDMRYQLTKFKSFELGSSDVEVKVKMEKTDIASDTTSVLEKVWVRAEGFPLIARKEEIVKKVAHLIGDPIEVDPISLIRSGPVRVKVACRDAAFIRGENEVFFNFEGKMIKWIVENLQGMKNQQPPHSSSKSDRFRKEDEEEDNDETSQGSHNVKTGKATKNQIEFGGSGSKNTNTRQVGRGESCK